VSTVYSVPGMSCGHCVNAITAEVGQVAGVDSVEIDLETKIVTVHGDPDDSAVRAAIDEAGYEIVETASP
jgi:copper chaperone